MQGHGKTARDFSKSPSKPPLQPALFLCQRMKSPIDQPDSAFPEGLPIGTSLGICRGLFLEVGMIISNAPFSRSVRLCVVFIVTGFIFQQGVNAQTFTLSKEQLIKYTSKAEYERFPDGRPKVPDALLERLKALCAEEVHAVLSSRGFTNQFEGGDWKVLHPGRKLVGRAVTIQYMPARPDIADVDAGDAEARGQGRPRNQTVIDTLQPGDVIVADAFGSGFNFVGNKLAFAIGQATHNTGMVVDGGIYWLDRMSEFDLQAYFRSSHPALVSNVMVTGINIPIRIGNATVLPGDIVFGDREGVHFIPPHLVREVVESGEISMARDEWTLKMMATGKYKSSELYGRPADPELMRQRREYIRNKTGRDEPEPQQRPAKKPPQ
jgi:regulator of RNase E activity RraA